ncbi:hypothetical protein ACQP2P_15030 [Dactylosporangium sp. CA-139114]
MIEQLQRALLSGIAIGSASNGGSGINSAGANHGRDGGETAKDDGDGGA